MSEQAQKTSTDYVLPPSVVSKVDVAHLVNELEKLDSDLTAAVVRAKAGGQVEEPIPPSERLALFLAQNDLTIDDARVRSELITQVRRLKDNVPVLHMTFAVEADRASLEKLVQWLRTSIHPQAVIAVGLQPALVAGVYLRTPNHVHDLSLRTLFKDRRDVLVEQLRSLHGDK